MVLVEHFVLQNKYFYYCFQTILFLSRYYLEF